MKLPETMTERIAYVVEHKKKLIDLKKSAIKYSLPFVLNEQNDEIQKALLTNHKDDLEAGVIKRTIVGNTYNWLDSHGDVHLKGIFTKSIEERASSIMHFRDHKNELEAIIGDFESIYEKRVHWSDLGINKIGYTYALMADSNIKQDYSAKIFKMYLNNKINQHSVGMQYVKIDLAVNSDEYKEEMATWNKYIDQIGNPEKAEELGYFWAVSEAKLIEISAVVAGSNELTPTITNTKEEIHSEDEPLKDTHKDEPNNTSKEEQKKLLIQKLF
jgi:hypothetical protein